MEHLDETTIALFIERRLSDERARSLEQHIDGCCECRRLVAALGRSATQLATAPATPHAIERGANIDRYVVLDRVGAGAMGSVYAAFDPELDRKVAVKLLHRGAADRQRLRREAQALARISHPGVVAVHDVGTHDDQVFIAMELIGGGTFRSWLRERPRHWRAILACGIQVARGLAAAHAAGLVHRDVKPDNIFVDTQGNARIGDFGLAAGYGEPRRPSRPSDPVLGDARSALATELTAPNTIIGTPAYMAPEQLAGEPATPRSDQFGFCATMYEALFGVRPYNGSSIDEIMALMRGRAIADPASDRGVPKRIRFAIVRGLDVDPDARFATMDDLVAALTHDPWSRRRLVAIGAAGVVLTTGAVVLTLHATRDETNPCTTAPAELARVLSPAKRAQVRDAILGVQVPFAAETARRVDELLDAYGKRWVGEHTQACEATAIHGTQSEALLDKRMSCLDHSLLELDVTLETLASTDRDRVRHAVDLATALPSPARCADPDRLVAVPPAEKAAEIEAVTRDVERARALLQVAAVDKAAELAGQAVTAAERLQYAPLLAEAYDIRGQANLPLGNPQLTRESFEKATVAAATAGDLELEARSLANLALVLRNTSADGKVAIEHAKHALAVAQRAKRDPSLEAQIRYVLISVLAGIDMPAVMEHFTKGRELLAQPSARDTRTLKLDYDVIEAKLEINPNSAIEKYEKTLLLAEELYGKDHPQVAAILVEMANMGVVAERYDEVRAWSKRIAQILEPYPGDRAELRRIDAALERDPKKRRPILEEVVRISAAAGGERGMQLAMDREKLAETLLELEAWKDGLVQIDAAIATWEALYGGQFELMITSLVTKAQLHAGLEQWDEVTKAAERANAIVDNGGMRELVKVMARLILMDSYFRQKRYTESLALIEEAAPTIRLALLGDPITKLLDFYAAACNWELGRDRAGSLKQAKEALAIIKTSELVDEPTLAPLREWLRGK